MHVKISDIDQGHASTPMAGQKLFTIIEPVLSRGEIVVLDFTGVRFYGPAFFNYSIGALIEKDYENRLPALLRYDNLTAEGQRDLDWILEEAIWRRENPRRAEALNEVAQRRSVEAWE